MTGPNTTRDRIVREATRLFAAQGIKATTVAEIEGAVGLRKGSGGVHRYFATKNDLVRAVFDTQLEHGQEALTAVTELPAPAAGDVRPFLEAIGRLALTRANENREVALIMLRDAHNLPPGLLDAQHTKNFELTYESAAAGLRELSEATGSDSGLDADALGYLLLAPLIYFRLIEWATNRRILDLDDDRLLAAWVDVFEPVLASLVQGAEPAPDDRTPVVVVAYDESWPAAFDAIAADVRVALGARARDVLHHGSTAVPGLAAKPVIDVALLVDDSADEGAYLDPLTEHGYRLVVREPEWFEHRMFKRDHPAVNLHVYSVGCEEVDRVVRFRDWLRTHDDDRDLYQATKQELATRTWERVQDYADAKSAVIAEITARADAAPR